MRNCGHLSGSSELLLIVFSYIDPRWMHRGHRDRSRSAGRIARESADRVTQWRQARRGGKADRQTLEFVGSSDEKY